MSIAKSDLHLQHNVICAYGTWYNKNTRQKAKQLVDIVNTFLPLLSKKLDLPPDLTIRLCNIKSRNTGARYWGYSKLLEIDVRCSNPLLFLCHELVHAEQYHTKKLTQNGTWFTEQHWMGKLYPHNPNMSHDEYMNLPWEKEAYEREDILYRYCINSCG